MSTLRTDILISIHPEHMAHIVSREKDHEFRKYLTPRTVERMWLYVSAPTQTLAYVAHISPAKVPGEVDTEGLGNDTFNAGEGTSHAYEILHLYQLKPPLKAKDMKEKYGIAPPRKYAFLKRTLAEAHPLEEQEKLF